MKGFKRGEKGFTLVEMLIVVAVIGILAAIVIPSVIGLMGRGGEQAYNTDSKTIQTAAYTFYTDPHSGWRDIGDDDDPLAGTGFDNNVWGDSSITAQGHYFPTSIGVAGDHTLTLNYGVLDPENDNPQVWAGNISVAGDYATLQDMENHAIWMGLLVNSYDPGYVASGGRDSSVCKRWSVSPLDGERAAYLAEMPKSAMLGDGISPYYNGYLGAKEKGGTYLWVMGKDGRVYGTYTMDDGATWYAGDSGVYP